MKNDASGSKKGEFGKKLKAFVLYVAAVAMSILFCIESISNGNLNTFDWVGIGIAGAIIVFWILNIGIFINRRKTARENREFEKAMQAAENSSDEDDDILSDEI